MQKFTALWSAVKALFSKSTIDSLISDVEQRVTHLTVVADAKAVEQKVHQDAINARLLLLNAAKTDAKAVEQKMHQDAINARLLLLNAAKTEETRARVIAAKFSALISAF